MNYKFNRRRNYKLITPCCGRDNKDGKFVNYVGLEDNYGYCHSCGKAILPPVIYEDDTGDKYIWDNVNSEFMYADNSVIYIPKRTKPMAIKEPELRFINENSLFESVDRLPENKLLQYIRNTYGNDKTEKMINWYLVGTATNSKTQFWYIDIDKKVRKDKVVLYNENGKRTSDISSTYLNSNGYKTCLFGEHLLSLCNKDKDIVVLVESEKTAIIASLLLPKYIWLSYGSINGLTTDKMKVLKGYRVLIIPDMSEKAISIINSKIEQMVNWNIDVRIWIMSNGKTDEQLKIEGTYNQDLEDILRGFNNKDKLSC